MSDRPDHVCGRIPGKGHWSSLGFTYSRFFYYFSIDFFNNLFNVLSVYKTPRDIIQMPLGHLLVITAITPFLDFGVFWEARLWSTLVHSLL